MPSPTKIPIKISGALGRFFTTNLRCGCIKTNATENNAKYSIYGVKIAVRSAIANKKQYDGFGLFSPCIFDPSQSSKVGQNTIMISGVPLPAKNKNGVESTTREDARSDTLFLNQRFKSNISSTPSNNPMIILGNLIA